MFGDDRVAYHTRAYVISGTDDVDA